MTEIGPLVMRDLEQRIRMGRAKYGVPLYAHTKVDPLVEAYEELQDMLLYLRAEIERRGGMNK